MPSISFSCRLFFNLPERLTNGIADEFRSLASSPWRYAFQLRSYLIIQFNY